MDRFGIFVREMAFRKTRTASYVMDATDKRTALASALHRFYGTETLANARHTFGSNDNSLHIAFDGGMVATAEIAHIN